MPISRYSQVNTSLPLLLRHLPRILCGQDRRESKWTSGGNGVILAQRTVAASCVTAMGLNNQKVYSERRDSKRGKSTMTGMNMINNPKLFKVGCFFISNSINLTFCGKYSTNIACVYFVLSKKNVLALLL